MHHFRMTARVGTSRVRGPVFVISSISAEAMRGMSWAAEETGKG